jgi:copper homeostasis protein
MKNIQLELCAASVKAIQLAKKRNFDRIELCQNLEQGGTTPSLGMIQFAVSNGVKTHVLIRQRSGDFVYTEDEIQVMITDVKRCNLLGVKGVVVGALTNNKEIDLKTIIQMLESVEDIDFTFHRAFDDIIDWKKAMDLLIQLNFKRILTSGGHSSVDEGFEKLKEMVQYANGRIEIMVGGGVHSENIKRIKDEIQPSAIHFSATNKIAQNTSSLFSTNYLEIDEEQLKSILNQL